MFSPAKIPVFHTDAERNKHVLTRISLAVQLRVLASENSVSTCQPLLFPSHGSCYDDISRQTFRSSVALCRINVDCGITTKMSVSGRDSNQVFTAVPSISIRRSFVGATPTIDIGADSDEEIYGGGAEEPRETQKFHVVSKSGPLKTGHTGHVTTRIFLQRTTCFTDSAGTNIHPPSTDR